MLRFIVAVGSVLAFVAGVITNWTTIHNWLFPAPSYDKYYAYELGKSVGDLASLNRIQELAKGEPLPAELQHVHDNATIAAESYANKLHLDITIEALKFTDENSYGSICANEAYTLIESQVTQSLRTALRLGCTIRAYHWHAGVPELHVDGDLSSFVGFEQIQRSARELGAAEYQVPPNYDLDKKLDAWVVLGAMDTRIEQALEPREPN